MGPCSRLAMLVGCWVSMLTVGSAQACEVGLSEPVAINAAPISTFTRFGDDGEVSEGTLEFLGGLQLSSANACFGGWSGVVVSDDGTRMLAISDTGLWLKARLEYSGGNLAGVSDGVMGRLRGQDGSPLQRTRYRDAEGVTLRSGSLDDGSILVSFERKARIVPYSVTADGVSAAGPQMALPGRVRAVRRNQSLESVAVIKGGTLAGSVIAFAERLYGPGRVHTGWIWRGDTAEPVYLSNLGDFDITDVASDQDGTIYVLERRFRWTEGVKMRIRRLRPQDLQPGATAMGETLIEADLAAQIDNMEGLSVRRDQRGNVILTLISDDNFNRFLQRTLLLQFAVRQRGGTTTDADEAVKATTPR